MNGLRSPIKTQKSVSSGVQTLQSWLQKLNRALFFQPTSQCLDTLMKHSFFCLIQYINTAYLTVVFMKSRGSKIKHNIV